MFCKHMVGTVISLLKLKCLKVEVPHGCHDMHACMHVGDRVGICTSPSVSFHQLALGPQVTE